MDENGEHIRWEGNWAYCSPDCPGVDIAQFYYPQGGKLTSIPWAVLHRSNYQTDPPTPPGYRIYTVVMLNQAYFIFWVILFIQIVVIFVVKLKTCKSFRNARIYTKVSHAVTSLIIPDAFNDWDEDLYAGVETLRQRFQEVSRDVTTSNILHWRFNMVLLVPIFVTGMELTQ